MNFFLKIGIDLEEITISGNKDDLINSDKTGAGFLVTMQLQTLPTISGSAADLTDINPLTALGGSFGGRNDQLNYYTPDDAIWSVSQVATNIGVL